MEEQKYTEGVNFETDEWFVERLKEFPDGYRIRILEKTLPIMDQLPTDNGWTQSISGVIKNPSPIFYSLEFLKQENELPYLIDVEEIDSDEYLDAVLEKNTIEYYEREKTINTEEHS